MKNPSLARLLPGPFNFLIDVELELQRLFPPDGPTLPIPGSIFLEDEEATPLVGFPVAVSKGMEELRAALESYIAVEEEVQLAVVQRRSFDHGAYEAAWRRYRPLLVQAVEHATISSAGRQFPAIFWLLVSQDIARCLKSTPSRMRRLDLEVGKRRGNHIKYRVFERLLDRILTTTYDTVQRLAKEVEELEEELFPRLLSRMFDNVLIFTEDHVSSGLAELASYFQGHLSIDPHDLRHRFAALVEWHEQQLAEDPRLRAAVRHLLEEEEPEREARQLLNRPGYLSFLQQSPYYDAARLLPAEQVPLWESLLVKLKEFEILSALRRLILPVRREDDRLVFRAGGLERTWVGHREIYLSHTTRPLDFTSPWVVDPKVQRFGMIYDITNFSQVVSLLRRSGADDQETSFRMMFRFQRRTNRLAVSHRLQLEKYLGDGAFYTSRDPRHMLWCAIELQRLYRRALAEGLPFDRGMRIGINVAEYRLFPIRSDEGGRPDQYEFFGHGIVELTRLTAGKGHEEIEEVQNLLITHGYPRQTVLRFFSPLTERNVDLVDREAEERPFYAYINRNGNLVNEGIVASGSFVAELSRVLGPVTLERRRQEHRNYVVVRLTEHGKRLPVGLRKLGVAHLKGLDDLPVYEIVDADDLESEEATLIPDADLYAALDRQFADVVTGSA
jgi:hypothetical protein